MSNATLAARLSALVDKWNGYKNALRDLLTKPYGTVDMEDGTGTIVTLPTFPALQKTVTTLTDSLTGAVAEARDLNSQAVAYAGRAQTAASAADTSAHGAADAAVLASSKATSAVASAAASDASAVSAAASQASAASSKDSAATSMTTAKSYADNAGFSAGSAQSSKDAAAASQTLAMQYANAAVNVQVAPGQYSAFHWAEQARLISAGALIYRGMFDATTGSMPASPKLGDFYVVSKAGTVAAIAYAKGDMVLYDGTAWDRIDNQTVVTSVAGRTGAVVIGQADVTGLTAALGAKLDTSGFTWTGLPGKPATFAPSAHTHAISEVNGLQAALDAKAPSANPTLTGTVTLPSFNGGTTFASGTGDQATYASHNTRMHLHWGLGIEDYAGTVRGVYDARTGTWDCLGGFKVNGQAVWHAGNYNPATKASLNSNVAFNQVTASYLESGVSGGSRVSLNTGGANGGYAAFFMPDGTRAGYIGNPDASTLMIAPEGGRKLAVLAPMTSQTYAPDSSGGSYLSGNGSGLQASGSFYLAGPVLRLWANSAGWSVQPRVFVQATDPGVSASDGDLWIW